MSFIRIKEQTEPTTPPTGRTVLYVDSADKHTKQKDDAGLVIDLTGEDLNEFIELTDTPSSYAGQGGLIPKVNVGETALEFVSAGSGDVVGPGSSTDNAITRFNGTAGNSIQNSNIIIDDSDNITGVITLDAESITATDSFVYSDESTQSFGVTPDNTKGHLNTIASLQSFVVTAQGTSPVGVFFRDDGLKLYTVDGSAPRSVQEYDLSTAWDVTTSVFLQTLDISVEIGAVSDLTFKSDGTKMYVLDLTADDITEYDLSTPWDISTATVLQTFFISGNPSAIVFHPTGKRMYVSRSDDDVIQEYDLSIAWDISTAVFNRSFVITAEQPQVTGLAFSNNGTVAYTTGSINDTINEWALTTPWDISTLVNIRSIDVSGTDINPQGLFVRQDLEKLYLVGNDNESIFEFDLGIIVKGSSQFDQVTADSVTATDSFVYSDESTQAQGAALTDFGGHLSEAVFSQSLSVSGQGAAPQDVFFRSDGLKMYVVDSGDDEVNEYDLSTAWDVTTAVFLQLISVAAQGVVPTGITFKPDGSKMYTTDSSDSEVNEYDLSTPWDVTTAVFLQLFDVSNEEANPFGVVFHPTGQRMYVVGNQVGEINEYTLLVAWDISTAVFNQVLNISAEQSSPVGLTFNSTGTRFYTCGSSADTINEWVMTTPWDISTATRVNTLDILAQDGNPTGVFLKPDNTRLYLSGISNDSIYEYNVGALFEAVVADSVAADIVTATDSFVYSDGSTQPYAATPDGIGWQVTTASFNQSFSLVSEDTVPNGMFFRSDGLKMYVVGGIDQEVNEYDLSTSWDISTAVFNQSFSTSAQQTSPSDVFFRSDGTKMYVSGGIDDEVNEYDLSTAWDISTAVFLQVFTVSEDTSVQGLFFKPDGTKMYVVGNTGNEVNEYDLSTAWDISSASFNQVVSVSEDATPIGIFFKSDGNKMYVVGNSGDEVNEYDLSTPWDISTSSFNQLFSVANEETSPRGVFFKPDGTKMYVTGDGSGNVNEYDLGIVVKGSSQFGSFTLDQLTADIVTATDAYVYSDGSTQPYAATPDGIGWHVTTAVFNQDFDISTQETTPQGMFFRSDGLKMYVVGNDVPGIQEYDLSTVWDVSSASFNQSFNVSAQDLNPRGVFFRQDGLKMYIAGNDNDNVYEYDLSTAWDISTASFNQFFDISSVETGPKDLFFKPDGTVMFVMGTGAAAQIHIYDLSTAWDISTAVFDDSELTLDTSPQGLFFRSDGLKMYVAGNTGDDINEFDLSSPWDISTAVLVREFSIATEDTSPRGLSFKPDGTKMYMVGAGSDSVYEYDLGVVVKGSSQFDQVTADSVTATDAYVYSDGSTQAQGAALTDFGGHIDAAIFSQSLSVSGQGFAPQDVFFRSDGLKMYVVDSGDNEVNEYDLSAAWDVTTAVFLQLFNVNAQATVATGIYFKTDGSKMYVTDFTGSEVNEYDLSTAWDISTSSFNQRFDVSAQETTPHNVVFHPTGQRMYVVGNSTGEVNQYDLGTPWDISTAVFNQVLNISAEQPTAVGLTFNSTGTRFYTCGSGADTINEWVMTTPWDISTATRVSTLDVSNEDAAPTGVFLKPDNTRLYLSGIDNDSIYEYNVGALFEAVTADSVTADSVTADIVTATDSFVYSDGSTQPYAATPNGTKGHITTARNTQSFSVAPQDSSPQGLYLRSDGLKMYVMGNTNDDVFEYDLSTAWDVTTAVFLQSFNTGLIGTTGVTFRPSDGRKMYISDNSSDVIREYDLSTGWDVTTASALQVFSVASQDDNVQDLRFSPDGKRFYIIGIQTDEINQYDLGTPWDISTAVFNQVLNISAFDTSPRGFDFSPDGKQLYFVGVTNNTINEFVLTTPWDISTAVQVDTLDVSNLETVSSYLVIRPDGSNIFFGGSTSDSVFSFDLGLVAAGLPRLSTDTKQIFTPADLDEFLSGDVYTVSGHLLFMESMTLPGRFVTVQGADVIYEAISQNIRITMTNTGTLFTHDGLDFRHLKLDMLLLGSGCTMYNIINSEIFLTQRYTVTYGIGNQRIGDVNSSSIVQLLDSLHANFADGIVFETTNILAMDSVVLQSTFATANTLIDIQQISVQSDFDALVLIAGPSESLINVDPTITAVVDIDNAQNITGLSTFFKTGTVGDTTLYADASVSGSVASVADNGSGFARFTTSAVHGMFTGQTVTNSGFSDSNYNTTDVIVVISTTEYDILSVTFTATGTGSFASDSVTVTSTAHGQSNGQTLKIRETLNYDAGYTIYNTQTNTFDINAVFVTAETIGQFDTGSLTQKDPNLLISDSGNQPDSATSAEVTLVNNTLETEIPAADALVMIASTPDFTATTEERIFVTLDGEAIYRGSNPATLKLDANITMEPATATKNLAATFFRQDAVRNTVTFTNATNLINETATALSDDDDITFNSNVGTLPAEIREDIVYFVINKLTNSFQISYTLGGSAITFTDDGSGTNTYATGELHGSIPTSSISAANPGTVVPQALAVTETDDILYNVISNKDDSVNIIVSESYYRVAE